MTMVAQGLVALVALLHVWFLVLEMFLVRQPLGQKLFRLGPAPDPMLLSLFANQGLYNGFLVAGLVWGLLHPVPAVGWQIQVFFLVCVLVAGLYGGLTTLQTILFIQALPALLALAAVWAVRAA